MHDTSTSRPPRAVAAHVDRPARHLFGGEQPAARRLIPVAGVLVALLLGLAGLLWAYNASHEGRIYNGVRVLGAELGGLDRSTAEAELARAGAGFPDRNLEVSAEGKAWTFSPSDLGAGIDAPATTDAAMRVGRGGTFDSVGTIFGSRAVAPVLKYDPALVDQAVARIAAEIDRPAVDSKLERGEDGKVVVTPSSEGRVVDRDALRAGMSESLAAQTFAPVAVTMSPAQPKITEAALEASAAQALLLTEEAISIKAGKRAWAMEPEDLRPMIALAQAPDGAWTAALDAAAITEYLTPTAEKMLVEPVDAAVVLGKEKVTLREEESGQEMDLPGAVAAIQEAAQLRGEERAANLPISEIAASVHTEQVRPVYEKANGLVTSGLRLWYDDDGYILRGASVIGFIDVSAAQGGPGALKLVVDEDVLANRITGVAGNFNRPPADASFRMVGGAAKRMSAGRKGIKVDVASSLTKATEAIAAYKGGERLQVELVVSVTEPKISNADISSISTPDLLGSGETSYKGSSPERAHNVELGARKIDGALIPPGGVFSTVDTIGDLTLDAGFKMGYMIINTGKEVKTIPAEAGGICQVSTTLFHSVFWSGLQIVERNWHSYWIASYGQAPSGLQGLDSTIAPPEKDFRFKNNTGSWILIRATAGSGKVAFKIYGVDPGWSVKVSDPVISNVVKSDPAVVREESDALPRGKEVKVETAQNGFTASINRVVTDSQGKVVDDWTARSKYVPAKNRVLVGTGPAQP